MTTRETFAQENKRVIDFCNYVDGEEVKNN
jgi:hypothetical protein